MAGIYIHVPFCKTRCHYCDFFKSTNTVQIESYLQGLYREIEVRASELENQSVDSIYIGGGTPTMLSVWQINELIVRLHENFTIKVDAEITLECNPDDLTPQYVTQLKDTAVNRLSIGTQSFQDCDLKLMNRRHCAMQSIYAVHLAQEQGFDNINIDLIYGLPSMTMESWQQNIAQALALNVPHISAYHLTYHEGTVFYKRLQERELLEIPDEQSFEQFRLLREKMADAGYAHYEISNFAKNERYSNHNRSYWERKPYIGLGPSAHSFDIATRRWNCDSVEEYAKGVQNDSMYYEVEQLSEQDQYNDFVITTLRTQWGVVEAYLKQNFASYLVAHFKNQIQAYIKQEQVIYDGESYTLSTSGLFISDAIMEDLCFFE
ncbi:MAG: radical SAM family heme chaperone HemW [Mangrovibacterium sp.]